jgi:hypothetical protein
MKSDFSAFVNPNKKIKKEYEVEQTDAFDSFLATLSEQLGNLKKINQDIFEENLIYSQPEKLHTKTNTSVDTKKYLNFLEELETIQKTTNSLPEENKDITNISSQINEELKKFKLQLGRMALEGGGGTNAVQYANGGYMDGDLLVSGDITALGRVMQDGNDLSADISNLKTFIQTNSSDWDSSGDDQMKFAADIIGDGVTTDFTFSHSLGTPDLVANVIDKETNAIVLATIIIDDTDITVEFLEPFLKTYRLVVIGSGQPAVSLGTIVSDSEKWNNSSNAVIGLSSSWNTGIFNLIKVTESEFIESNEYSHFLYDDDLVGSSINVTLLPVGSHTGVKFHKKIGDTGSVTLTPPAGVTIDGESYFSINTKNQTVGLFTDGINYFIQ